MTEFHKIWVEVDVDKDSSQKTEKILKIVKSLQKLACVVNVTKSQYIAEGEEVVSKTKLEE